MNLKYHPLSDFLKRHSLLIGIMFLFTWPVDLANSGLIPIQVPGAVSLLVGYGFVVASILMTGLTSGKEQVIRLLRRFLIWRVAWKWYLAALLLVPAVDAAAIYLHALLSQTPVDFTRAYGYELFGPSANPLLLMIPFFAFETLTNGEEIGWRGYVLPRLQAKHSALISSLVLGAIWAAWHVPKFLPHWDTTMFALYVVDTMARAIQLTWLYNNTRGSLLLAALFHASSNTAGILLPIGISAAGSGLSVYIFVVLLSIMAAVVITLAAGPARLSRTGSKEVQEGPHLLELGLEYGNH